MDLNKKIKESAAGFLIDKTLSFAAGLAAVVIGGIVFPVTDIVFQLYAPLTSFLAAYIYFCFGVFILTILIWIAVWRKPLLRSAVPYGLSLVVITVAGLMRSEILFPNIIGIQFLLFFGGILLLCEALIIHVLLLGHDLLIKLKLIKP